MKNKEKELLDCVKNQGDLDAINKIINQIFDINEYGKLTMLGVAAKNADFEAMEKLFEAGANPNLEYWGYKQNYTALFTFIEQYEFMSISEKEAIKIVRLFVKNGACTDYVPKHSGLEYQFDATNFALYKNHDVIAAELYRLGADVQKHVQNTGIVTKGNQAILASKAINIIAKEEFLKFFSYTSGYKLPQNMHSNTLEVLKQFYCEVDLKNLEIKITHRENDEYLQARVDGKKGFNFSSDKTKKFESSKSYSITKEKADIIVKKMNSLELEKELSFNEVIIICNDLQKENLQKEESIKTLNDMISFLTLHDEEITTLGNDSKVNEEDIE
jgi:hypothetical protein